MKKNKLLIILPLTFVTIASVTNVFLSSCSPEETESQKMLNLYKDKSNLKTTSIDNSADYFTLWKDSVQKKDTWCLEYTIYLNFLFKTGLNILSGITQISLPANTNFEQLIQNNTVEAIFQTNTINVSLNNSQDTINITYLGYLRLYAIDPLILMYNNIPETYAKGTIVEFMFTLANLSFTVTNVVSAESGQWWTQDISPTIGDSCGLITIYNSDTTAIGSSNIVGVPAINSAANYFGAYKQ